MTLVLLIGSDPILVSEAVGSQIDEMIGDGDRSLMLEILTAPDYFDDSGEIDPTRLVVAGATPPFLTDRRVVVGRGLSMFSRKDLYSSLIEMIGTLLDTTDLLLVWEKPADWPSSIPEPKTFPALPKAIKEAVELAGGVVVDSRVGRGKQASAWLRDQLAASNLSFERDATRAVEELLGEDLSDVVGLLRTLEGALGTGTSVSAQDIATYGGAKGSVAPWDLDDAIDRGDVAGAISVVHRIIPLTSAVTDRSSAAFRLVSMLQRRYSNMLRLDGAGVHNEKDAAALLGMKGSTFPAKKAMQQGRRLGSDAVAQSVRLIADADLALRGTMDFPPELTIELLVARLANLSRAR